MVYYSLKHHQQARPKGGSVMQNALQLSQTIALHREGLERLLSMWLDPKVLFYEDPVPEQETSSAIFLAGPTSRHGIPDYMWRKDAVHFLRRYGYSGKILVPEPRGYSYLAKERPDDFTDAQKIYQWEYAGLKRATHRVFWIPRNKEQLLGLTTNREIAQWMGRAENSKKISASLYIGWPDDAAKTGSLNFELQQSKVGIKKGEHFRSLEELCKELAAVFELDDDIPF